jgi:hypothetical protein
MAKLRIFVDGPLPKNADELDDLNRAMTALTEVHGVELRKVSLQWSSSSKQFSAFYATETILPVNG